MLECFSFLEKKEMFFSFSIDQGPPDGWRGPDERMDDGPWGDFGSEADGSMRGRGKPRGGRRGRGGRR